MSIAIAQDNANTAAKCPAEGWEVGGAVMLGFIAGGRGGSTTSAPSRMGNGARAGGNTAAFMILNRLPP